MFATLIAQALFVAGPVALRVEMEGQSRGTEEVLTSHPGWQYLRFVQVAGNR